MSYIISVDLGGTTGRVGAIDPDHPTVLIDREEFAVTQHDDGAPGDFNQDLKALTEAILTIMRRQEHRTPTSIGMALAGKLDDDRTTLTAAGNLGHWVGKPITKLLGTRFDLPVVLRNDAEAAALAEALHGHGRGKSFWCLIWGTGLGGCQVRWVDDKPLLIAGEPGHQLVDPHSSLFCGCGQQGCLELQVGGKGIAKRFGRPAEKLDPDDWEEVAEWMAIGVQNLVAPQPVDLVVFSGGIANKRRGILMHVWEILDRDLRIVRTPDIALSAFGEDTGLVGAAATHNAN